MLLRISFFQHHQRKWRYICAAPSDAITVVHPGLYGNLCGQRTAFVKAAAGPLPRMHAEILHDFSRARACACAQERLYSEKAFDVAVSAVSGALLRSGPH